MAITITTLNNSSAVAKTFTELGKGPNESHWYNASDESPTLSVRLLIRNRNEGKTRRGDQIRRSTVTCKLSVPTTISGPYGGEIPTKEEITAQFSIVRAPLSPNLTTTQLKDVRAYLVNLLTESVFLQLCNGEV